jgi:hypothetical protein
MALFYEELNHDDKQDLLCQISSRTSYVLDTMAAQFKHVRSNSSCVTLVLPRVSVLFCPLQDRLRGLVVRVPGYRSRDTGFESCATRFSEKWWVRNGVRSTT